MAIEEAKSRLPGELRLAAVAKVEDVHASADDNKLDRSPEFGQPSRQAKGLLDIGRAVAVAVHKKDRSSNGLGVAERGSPLKETLQLFIAHGATGPTKSDTDQPKNESPPQPCPRRAQPAFKVGHRVIGDHRGCPSVIRSDEQAEYASLREAQKANTFRIHVRMDANPIYHAFGISRILPWKKALPPTSTFSALIVHGYREIPCVSQIVEDSAHVGSAVSRFGVDNYDRQWSELCWPNPFQAHAQAPACYHLAPAMCPRRRMARVHEVMINAPRKKKDEEQKNSKPRT